MNALLCLANLTTLAAANDGPEVLALLAGGLLLVIILLAATNRPAPPPIVLQLPAQPTDNSGGCLTLILVAGLVLVTWLLLSGTVLAR